MFRHNNFACGLCLSIFALTKKKKAKKHQYPTFSNQYLPTPFERSENLWLWCNKIFTLVPRLNPSLGFATVQEIQNTKNKNKKQRRNLHSGSFRPRPSNNISMQDYQNRHQHQHHYQYQYQHAPLCWRTVWWSVMAGSYRCHIMIMLSCNGKKITHSYPNFPNQLPSGLVSQLAKQRWSVLEIAFSNPEGDREFFSSFASAN